MVSAAPFHALPSPTIPSTNRFTLRKLNRRWRQTPAIGCPQSDLRFLSAVKGVTPRNAWSDWFGKGPHFCTDTRCLGLPGPRRRSLAPPRASVGAPRCCSLRRLGASPALSSRERLAGFGFRLVRCSVEGCEIGASGWALSWGCTSSSCQKWMLRMCF